MKLPVSIALAALVFSTQAQAAETAGARLAQCTGDEKAVQECTTYIIGWKVGYEIFSTTCIPEDASGIELREAFVEYAKAAPERSEESDRDVLKDALFARWPCR